MVLLTVLMALHAIVMTIYYSVKLFDRYKARKRLKQ